MNRRIASWGLALATTITVLGGCTYQDDETVLGTLEDPVDAKIVFIEQGRVEVQCKGEGLLSLCWPGSVRERAARLEVGGPHPFSVEVPGRMQAFDRVDLAADPDGERFAYRTEESGWRLVYAGYEGTGYVFGPARADETGQPDWAASPTFRGAAPRLFAKARYAGRQALLADVRNLYGDDGVVEFLDSTLDVWPRGHTKTRRRDAAWGEAYRALPEAAQQRLRSKLRRKFLNGRLGTNATVRTLRYLDLSEDHNLDRMRRLVRDEVQRRRSGFGRRPVAQSIMLRALARNRPRTAGKLACQLLATEEPHRLVDGGPSAVNYYRESILLAVVAGGTRCEAAHEAAQQLGLPSDADAFEQVSARTERIRPKREFFGRDRKPVEVRHMKRLLSAAVAAPTVPPKRRKPRCR